MAGSRRCQRAQGGGAPRGRHSAGHTGNRVYRENRVPVDLRGLEKSHLSGYQPPCRDHSSSVIFWICAPHLSTQQRDIPARPIYPKTTNITPHRLDADSVRNISFLRPKNPILAPQAGLLTLDHRPFAAFSASANGPSRQAPHHSSGPVGESHPVPVFIRPPQKLWRTPVNIPI